ncbi:MAG: septal ring lytic transglycosylase RlpA family protein [Gammaproteobacteria bacterium]|nr:septal ring lytic transglycosylase RlpA family protein [Gammaproteobacteria bacterium]
MPVRLHPTFSCFVVGCAVLALLSACSSGSRGPAAGRDGPGDGRDVSQVPDAVPRVEPRSRGGNPASYVVFGKRYYTMDSSAGYRKRGIASWYGSKFHGRRTSNGEVYDMYAMSAAHKELPIPTYVEVTNLENGRQVIVRVNDRGPFHENRIIDLSYAAASRIGMLSRGTAMVEVRAIDPSAPKVAASPTPAPSVRPATRERDGQPRIFLQAGSFRSEVNAERYRQRLERDLDRAVRVMPFSTGNGRVHRVQVGPINSVELADRITSQMHAIGVLEPLVIID